jgi:putative (di)nucleoside polyphosphate hydrolase
MAKRKLPLRPNVCMLVYNKRGQLFLGERLNKKAHWQFPQGGAEKRYSLRQNVVRELQEELGIARRSIGSIRKLAATHRYDWAKVPSYAKGKWRGQSQTFWMVEFIGKDSDIDLCAHEEPEFRRWRWASVPRVRKLADPRRLQGYEAALKEYLAKRPKRRRP